uniref:Uncharacterized protein n=1 Tax=Arundo donax TaxID=35708 RepID=A0A0A9S8K1_ARUDO
MFDVMYKSWIQSKHVAVKVGLMYQIRYLPFPLDK